MTTLNIETNIADPDAFYEKLIDAHNGLTDEQSHFMNAKLVLLLANHIGDASVLATALAIARADAAPDNDAVPQQPN
ncbi:hypothetical protein OKW43_007993 [Paraburkholderia sp. WC7.3g]|uniref:DUF2783 domain-containing protein n=1 Tax=Paraburkholderia podalyriae TaxID=1938811 RepID=A0ABR7PZ31_9BURK|nr:DUF2783 domain-containing protein [Paraburkholderia podalyriae]MBC8751545.1 DUF2783 domain-containing protein [Paraburkholderia podalyriae]